MKKILRLLAAALCLLPAAALGSVWQGSVEAARTAGRVGYGGYGGGGDSREPRLCPL